MKYSFFLFLFMVISCKSTQQDSFKNSLNSNSLILLSECPEPEKCSITVMENTSMSFSKDNANKLYPEFKPNENTMIIKYTFAVNMDQQASDGHYKEEILFEIPNTEKKLVLNDEELSKVKLLHGMFCYCKGAAGYYEVKNGKLKVENNELLLQFKNENVSQRIDSIKAKY
ncbi:hypothetical protein [Mesonia maritima]|uniref:Lipoprotein n=1 Tax=Mesonia maritima TaxID=1793873 RepID=A0ABU1K604_9FLAO|nr:hypothetical protein [Mesonia maritima]MDR6300726.1 hypothetical protein [Mesonia maritima]